MADGARLGEACSAASGSTACRYGSGSVRCLSSAWPTFVGCDPFAISTLLVLVSLSVSFWFFNEGRIFTSVPLVYPVLLYLLGRTLWIGLRDRAPAASRPVWPVWLIARGDDLPRRLPDRARPLGFEVIDVGYSGVIGAHRIVNGEAPYGHFPTASGQPCGGADRDGRIMLRVQANGRCEKQNEHGDTYGPVAYLAYVPGYALFGWKGGDDPLHAAHFTAIVFDLACLLGLVLVGLRYGGRRFAATLASPGRPFRSHSTPPVRARTMPSSQRS